MVETEANLTQVKVEVFLGYTTVRIEPMFCIAPESFNTVDVIPAFGFTTFFANDNMTTTHS